MIRIMPIQSNPTHYTIDSLHQLLFRYLPTYKFICLHNYSMGWVLK